jgi:hypothetical protein
VGTSGRRIPARFDPDAWAEDLARTTVRGRQVALDYRRRLDKRCVPLEELRPCDPEGRDGTQLPNCVKAYLPPPAGHFGIVFEVTLDEDGQLLLVYLAFGVRHHPRTSHKPTVYDIADDRLNAN